MRTMCGLHPFEVRVNAEEHCENCCCFVCDYSKWITKMNRRRDYKAAKQAKDMRCNRAGNKRATEDAQM